MHKSFAVRLSLRFMFVLTTSVLLLSLCFLIFVRSLVKANQTAELKNAERKIFMAVSSRRDGPLILDIPYYMSYLIYNVETENILATNDPFLPLLKDSSGKALRYYEKDFFFDGDLDILYYAVMHRIGKNGIICAVSINIDNDSFSVIFSKLPLALLLMSLPVLILSFFVSLFITKNTINPVVKITRAAQTLSSQNLDSQLPLSGRGDEIDELSKTFNELFQQIKADFDRERQFSSDVSHELNTPLTVISGQANLLLRWGKDDPEQLEKSLLAIKNESKSMHAIIDNLLQISRIESGRIKPQIVERDVMKLFRRVEEEFASLAPETTFEFLSPSEKFLIKTDSEMLHQILTIFVSNSIKFSNQKCKIKLSVYKDSNLICISESDDGPGISEEALPHVFERFYRADEAHTRSAGGSGLGLSIAYTLASALGVQISADNLEPHGASFMLTFSSI